VIIGEVEVSTALRILDETGYRNLELFGFAGDDICL
jgi:hypothetical protein